MKKNKLVITILSIAFIGLINLTYGKVYKYVQPDGTVLLTDNPQKGAEQVDYNENTWSSSNSQRPDVQKILDESRNIGINDNKDDKATKDQTGSSEKLVKNQPEKQKIEILYPTDNTYIRNGVGEILVKTNAVLKPGQAIKSSLDGTVNDQLYDNPSFLLKNIDRGEHILLVSIVNKDNGSIILSSNPVKFYMYRNIIRQNKPLPAR